MRSWSPGSAVVEACGLVYRFRPADEEHGWVQERQIDGNWEWFCTYDLRPADPSARGRAFQQHHTPGESWVVGDLMLIRCREDALFAFRDGQLTCWSSTGKRSEHVSLESYPRVASDTFGIPEPAMATALEALAEWGMKPKATD
jgi:arylamine N-acetyltransferase